ncbi:MAG: hypothetical protein K8R87_11390 [Verrucomicrobia bacterium]|nr:hypothetical protein [Verrucomicrobiota bacterium]
MKTIFHRSRSHARGAAMLMVLAFTIIGGIGITAWVFLLATRAIQSNRMSDSVARHLSWSNSRAINQQYSYSFAYRDTVTQAQTSATLSGGGGLTADAFTSLKTFNSLYTFTNPSAYIEPFHNLRKIATTDNSVYYTRTTAATDSTQPELVRFYNFQKSYPRALLGDLLITHAKPTGASGNIYISDNIEVNGRVLIYGGAADVSGVAAEECLNLSKTGTDTTLNIAGTAALLPSNFSSYPIFMAGSDGAGTGAVTDGTLNILKNTNFAVNSVYTDLTTDTLGYYVLSSNANSATPFASGANIDSNKSQGVTGTATNGGSATSDIWMKTGDNNPFSAYPEPTTSPYNYSWTKGGSAVTILLKSATQHNLYITSGVTQLILQGQTNAADYTNAASLSPLIILVEQEIRDIRFNGENSRPLVLGLGTGTGVTCFMSWSGSSTASGGGPLRWRLHMINQYRNIYLDDAGGNGVDITGSLRTNWHINCTNSTSNKIFNFYRDSNPGTLTTRLPRDAWLETVISQ